MESDLVIIGLDNGAHLEPSINTLRLRQNGRHLPDIFKCIFLNENIWISIKISLKFVSKDSINDIMALVQIMAWVIRPQWVNWTNDDLTLIRLSKLNSYIWKWLHIENVCHPIEDKNIENLFGAHWSQFVQAWRWHCNHNDLHFLKNENAGKLGVPSNDKSLVWPLAWCQIRTKSWSHVNDFLSGAAT